MARPPFFSSKKRFKLCITETPSLISAGSCSARACSRWAVSPSIDGDDGDGSGSGSGSGTPNGLCSYDYEIGPLSGQGQNAYLAFSGKVNVGAQEGRDVVVLGMFSPGSDGRQEPEVSAQFYADSFRDLAAGTYPIETLSVSVEDADDGFAQNCYYDPTLMGQIGSTPMMTISSVSGDSATLTLSGTCIVGRQNEQANTTVNDQRTFQVNATALIDRSESLVAGEPCLD